MASFSSLEDVVHCTDCKAYWGSVIVILGYVNKIDLIWFDLIWTQHKWLDDTV